MLRSTSSSARSLLWRLPPSTPPLLSSLPRRSPSARLLSAAAAPLPSSTSPPPSLFTEAFDTPSHPAPLAPTSPSGLFLHSDLRTPADFGPLVERTLRSSRLLVDRICAAPERGIDELRKVVKNLDRLSDGLCRVIDLAELVRNVHPNQAWVQAADETYEALCSYMNELNTHVGLYNVLSHTLSHPALSLDYSSRQVALVFLNDFEKSGIHLPTSSRRAFVSLSDEIISLGRRFLTSAATPSPARDVLLDASDLSGHSREFLTGLPPPEGRTGKRRVSAQSWEAQMLLRYSPREETRRKIYVAANSASEDEVQTLEELLSARNRMARLVGKESYAEVALGDKMAKTPENVAIFLSSLSSVHRPLAVRDIDSLSRSAQSALSLPTPPPVPAWSRDYYAHLSTPHSSLPPLHEYFSLGTVLSGLSHIFDALYGVSLHPVPLRAGEAWDAGVRKLEVRDEAEGVIGTVYADLWARHPKGAGAAHYTVTCSRRVDDDDPWEGEEDSRGTGVQVRGREGAHQLPVVVLACGFDEPSVGCPTLLAWGEVETIFHEMGHAIHSMLGRTPFQNVSGTRCPTDFVELPSILMEHLLSSPALLPLISSHHVTGAPLPPALLDAHMRNHNALPALETQGQLLMAKLDQAYHTRDVDRQGKEGGGWSTRVWYDLQDTVGVVGSVQRTAWQTQFGHLFGYGATYYSYLFDRSIASRVYSHLFSRDPLSRDAGERFKRDVLRWGGGRDPWAMLGGLLDSPETREEAEVVGKGEREAMERVGQWGTGEVGVVPK